tara:strand:+ start:73 stop:2331 length:2259 start_codon:yes stop_codon:yes gene_type:complete
MAVLASSWSRCGLYAVATSLSLHFTSALDNGIALTPPRGWRSWNVFGFNIDQAKIEEVIAALIDRSRGGVSLADLGFVDVGIDAGFEECFARKVGGIQAFHDEATGYPLVNSTLFPDMRGLISKAHGLGLTVSWYGNGCSCEMGENSYVGAEIARVMEGSARATAAYGFDGIKIDSCSQFANLTWWADVLNETGRGVVIEACLQGGIAPGMVVPGNGIQNSKQRTMCEGRGPGVSDCPYHVYRTSDDIYPRWDSVLNNINSVTSYLGQFEGDLRARSRPGGWAYPDMLEIGNFGCGEDNTPICDRRVHTVRNLVACTAVLLVIVSSGLGMLWRRRRGRGEGGGGKGGADDWEGTRTVRVLQHPCGGDGRGAHVRIREEEEAEAEEEEAEGDAGEVDARSQHAGHLRVGEQQRRGDGTTWLALSAAFAIVAAVAALAGYLGAHVGSAVGRAFGIDVADTTEDRSMFGMWCIVSSPLVLSLDLTHHAHVDDLWPILSNVEALAVNEHWSGSPGRLLLSKGMPNVAASKRGFVSYAGNLGQDRGWQGVVGDEGPASWQVGECVDPWTLGACEHRYLDLRVDTNTSVDAAEAWCAASPACDGFSFLAADANNVGGVTVYFKGASQIWWMDGTIFVKWGGGVKWSSRIKAKRAVPFLPSSPWPGIASGVQVWVKEYAATATATAQVALLLVNVGDALLHSFEISSSTLPDTLAGGASVRSIWDKIDLQPIAVGESLRFHDVAPHDSRFLMLMAARTS